MAQVTRQLAWTVAQLPFRMWLLFEDCPYGSKSNRQTSVWNVPCVYTGDFLCDISGHFGQALL